MTRKNRFRQCDLERAIRAAKATGAGRVTVLVDRSISIEVDQEPSPRKRREDRVIVL